MIFLCLGMTIAPIAKNKSILTSAAVAMYICYYTWSGLTSSPNDKCNAFSSSDNTLWIQIIVDTALYMIALLYVSYTNTTSHNVKISKNIDLAAQVVDDDPEDDE